MYAMLALLLASGLLTPLTVLAKDVAIGASAKASAAADRSAKATTAAPKKRMARAARKKTKEDEAIELVWRRPEVKYWLTLFPNGTSKLGGHPAANADHDQGDVYSVHVYEDLPDHVATFNWYDVNLKTGEITKKF